MKKQRKFSASAIVIMILLILNLVSGILLALTYNPSFLTVTELVGFQFGVIVFLLLNLFAFIGVARKTRWGLVITVVFSILDIILIVTSAGQFTTIFQDLMDLFFDLALLLLSLNILRRI